MREPDNIQELARLPIDYMGFIFYDKSARYTAALPQLPLPEHIKKAGVFVNADRTFVETKIASGLQAVQLHGQESPAFCQAVKKQGIEVIKAFGIDEQIDWRLLEPYVGIVDYFLFDTSSPQHGGTGRTFDWTVLAGYPYDTPYFLSGGLDLNNLPEALALDDEHLIGLDLNSKFELAPGLKDIDKLKKALKITRYE